MPARTPEEVPRLFAAAFGAHDVEAALMLYEPGATLIAQPGHAVTGTEAIREALGGLLALESEFVIEVKKAFQVGDVALLFSDWTLSAATPDGQHIEMGGRTADVVRRQPDGSWLLVIDDPFGADHGFAQDAA
ncbi:MAG TPA: nuclear transport factor 2 family protein [Rubrobacteraceae bacterium]|nr:nuclear transport factor 2 family protein [Rubrobacteraceae bacterium]